MPPNTKIFGKATLKPSSVYIQLADVVCLVVVEGVNGISLTKMVKTRLTIA